MVASVSVFLTMSPYLANFFFQMVDISGVPGTGKTATVHAVVKELKRMAQNSVRPPQFYGFKLTCCRRKPILSLTWKSTVSKFLSPPRLTVFSGRAFRATTWRKKAISV